MREMENEAYVGRSVLVTVASNPSVIGMEGVIEDETQNAFVIMTKKGKRTVPKAGAVFSVEIGGNTRIVDGNSILSRPGRRAKKVGKK